MSSTTVTCALPFFRMVLSSVQGFLSSLQGFPPQRGSRLLGCLSQPSSRLSWNSLFFFFISMMSFSSSRSSSCGGHKVHLVEKEGNFIIDISTDMKCFAASSYIAFYDKHTMLVQEIWGPQLLLNYSSGHIVHLGWGVHCEGWGVRVEGCMVRDEG